VIVTDEEALLRASMSWLSPCGAVIVTDDEALLLASILISCETAADAERKKQHESNDIPMSLDLRAQTIFDRSVKT